MRASSFMPLAIAALLFAPSTTRAHYNGNLNLFAGQAWLNTADWEPVDTQREFGLMLAFGEERAPIHFAMHAFVARSSRVAGTPAFASPVSSASTEFGLGVRKVWGRGVTRPHLGAGAGMIRVREEMDGPSGSTTDQAHGYGIWVDGGVSFRIGGHLNLGIDLRYTSARVDLGSEVRPRDVPAGGIHAGVLIGYGW